ncbi:MAG: ABC transporter ATP-binding protein/permease [Treponema sp.]|nr:ABC transporter ATP-binding protein/permease [Treponema sp.]
MSDQKSSSGTGRIGRANAGRSSETGRRRRGGGMGGPMGRMGAAPEKAKDFAKTIRKLVQYLMPYSKTIIAVFTLAILSVVFSIAGPKILGKATTKLIEGLMAYWTGTGLLTDFGYIGRIIGLLVVLYVFSSICSYAQSFLMSRVSMSVTYNLRKDISAKIPRIPLSYYDTRTHGEVLSRITNDIDLVSTTLNQSLTQLITSATTLVGVFVMMVSISGLMTFAALVVIPFSMGIMAFVISKSQIYFRGQQKWLGEANGIIEENYSGHNIVQAFNGEADAVEEFEGANNELQKNATKSMFITSILQPIMMFVGNLGYVMVAVLGGYLASVGKISIGDIQAFIQYMRNFTQPITQLASISNTLQSTVAAAERVFEFLDEPEESPDKQLIQIENLKGDVSFQHMHFGYNPDKIIINDFSAEVKAGQKVAIVGPTGAGKTTIVKLLMRFYDANSGRILVDGNNIYDLPRPELRNMFGMVLQETWLYNASILENIRYGTFGATDAEVMAAAKAAHCDEFIRALPGGYGMVLNEDASNISQGQKQLFTIARVILANPKILILDEATSSVDTRTEILIQKAMNELMKGRTSFVIAHRLSTIKDADLIFVMKDGDIVEQGNHTQLLKANGFYADLYNSQFNKGIVE